MFTWILFIILAFLFFKGLFKIAIGLLLGLFILRLIVGTISWLLSPQVLIPLLIIAGILWLSRRPERRKNYN